MPASRRDDLVETAEKLFARDGFRATGIDAILAEAGVAKMTLYHHFKSKDELVLAALRRRDERWRRWLAREVERRADSPRARLLAVFDVLGSWCSSKDFRGCLFINAAAEFGDASHPVRAAAAEHKRLTRSYLAELASAAGAAHPEGLAAQLGVLIEGAIVSTQVEGSKDGLEAARAAAAALVDAAVGSAKRGGRR